MAKRGDINCASMVSSLSDLQKGTIVKTQSARAMIRETIKRMDTVSAEILGEQMAMRGQSAKFFGQTYNEPMLEYAEKLLEGKSRRR